MSTNPKWLNCNACFRPFSIFLTTFWLQLLCLFQADIELEQSRQCVLLLLPACPRFLLVQFRHNSFPFDTKICFWILKISAIKIKQQNRFNTCWQTSLFHQSEGKDPTRTCTFNQMLYLPGSFSCLDQACLSMYRSAIFGNITTF